MEANTPTPSRKARKPILPRAYSASGGLIPRSPLKNTKIVCSGPFCVNRWDRPPGRPPGDSSGAVSGRSEPWWRTPSPLAQSAKDHPLQSLLSERRPDAADNVAERCRAGASLGGEHPTPSRKARKLLLPRAYSASGGLIPRSPPKNRSGAVSGRSEPWRRTPQTLAHSAKAHAPQSLLSERRPDTAEPFEEYKNSMQWPLLCK